MKIIAVGSNYPNKNNVLNNQQIPTEPTIFLKPDSAILKDGKPFFIPDFSNQIDYEVELVIKINRLGKNIAEKFAHRYYNEVTVGIDFTARDLLNRQQALGAPWEICKAFDGSAPIGNLIPIEEAGNINDIDFKLTINDHIVQSANSAEMIFSVDKIIEYVSRFYTLKIGDLIFTGTPVGIGPVKINDHLQGYIGNKKLLDFHVK